MTADYSYGYCHDVCQLNFRSHQPNFCNHQPNFRSAQPNDHSDELSEPSAKVCDHQLNFVMVGLPV
jgi:hypothetical protein